MRPKIRLLAAGLLALGLAGMSSAQPTFAASQQVADCTFATLQTDLQAGGDWYYAAVQCLSAITFTSTITIGTNASLTAQGNDITLDGGNSVQLFSVGSGATFGLTGLTLTHGNPAASGTGGAIYNNGTVTIATSNLSYNSTAYGGAIYNFGAVTISDSTLTLNSASITGGAMYNGINATVSVTNSTLLSNADPLGDGGAVYNAGNLTIANGTFVGNVANAGGAIDNHKGILYITSSTFSNNSANDTLSGAIYNGGTEFIGGTIIGKNFGGNCFNNGAINDSGYNLENSADCGFTGTGDLQNADPKLSPLANNGGPTQTQALLSGSPAIDHVPTSIGLCPATDQRRVTRPDSGETSCDIGAYEVQDQLPQTITFTTTPPNPALYGGSYIPTATGGGSGNPVIFSIDSSSTSGACSLSAGTVSFTGVGTCLIDANQAGGGGYLPAPQMQQSVTITPAPLTITASAGGMSYGGTPPTITPGYSGFVNGDTASSLTTAPSCTSNATPSTPAGTYPTMTSCSGAVDPNYTISYVKGTLTVSPAILTVTAINQSRLFGAPNPSLTVNYSGFVNGQTLGNSGVTGSPACSTTALPSSPAGSYPITCTLGTLAAANYSFTLVPGTLTVTYSSACLTGRHTGPLTVASGQSLCLGVGFSQTGPVRVNAGGALDGEGATITGPLQVNGATALRLCGVHLTGPLTVSSTTGPVLVGDDEGTTCAGNAITGPVQMNTNHGGVEFDANTVIGPVFISHTHGSNPAPDASPVDDTDNTVTGPNKVTP